MSIPTLSRQLRKLRKERGLSQVELAKRAGVQQKTLSEWESGKVTRINSALLDRVCGVLGVPLSELQLIHPKGTATAEFRKWREAVNTELEAFEEDARKLLLEIADDDEDEEGGWGKPPVSKTPPASTKKESPKAQRKINRATQKEYAEETLAEALLAHQALWQGDAGAAVHHALLASHHHGAARALTGDADA